MSGVDGGPVELHLVDSNGMGRMTLSRVVIAPAPATTNTTSKRAVLAETKDFSPTIVREPLSLDAPCARLASKPRFFDEPI